MDVLLLLFRLVLAGVLGIAGAAKLADLAGSRKAITDFGAPGSWAAILSFALPLLEICGAALLLFSSVSWYGALIGAALLAVFSVAMGVQIAKGKTPDCHCFGQIHSEPVSYKSLLRNIVFLIPAVGLLTSGPSRQGVSLADLTFAIVELLAVLSCVLLLAAAVYFLRKISLQQSQIMHRIELLDLISKEGEQVERQDAGHPQDGLPIGAKVPRFEITDIRGETFTTPMLADTRPSLLLFVSPTCSPCRALAPRFDEWETELSGRLNFIYVSSGTAEENTGKFGSGDGKIVLLQDDRELSDRFQARWTPTAVFVNSAGRIASHPATGDAAIVQLMDRIRASDLNGEYLYFDSPAGARPAGAASVGTPLPEFTTDALSGESVSSGALAGKLTLLTFWSPDCPHCVQMIDEIRDWDLAKSSADPQLILFSSGDWEKLREIGLKSPIVADKDFDLSGKLGMYGTPSAVLIDEKVRYASEVAVGAANIWALVGRD